jgi:hypothetical protein
MLKLINLPIWAQTYFHMASGVETAACAHAFQTGIRVM